MKFLNLKLNAILKTKFIKISVKKIVIIKKKYKLKEEKKYVTKQKL